MFLKNIRSESEFLPFLFKNTEERLYEAYINWLLTTTYFPPEDEDGFLWWLGLNSVGSGDEYEFI